jgi:type I restriction enzyme S subunit
MVETIINNLPIWTAAQTRKSKGRSKSVANQCLYGIDKLRELILDLAVRGKLVLHNPNDEPASLLLEKIKDEKELLIIEEKIKRQNPLPFISEEEIPFKLPNNWEWARLIDLCVLENGDRSKNYPNKSALVREGIAFINAGHLHNDHINMHEMNYISQNRYDLLRSGKVIEGDILYCLRGSLGKSAIVHDIGLGAIASSLVIVRPFQNTNNQFVLKYFNSPLATIIMRKYDNGTAQPNLSATDLAKFLIPVPPLLEQHRIVAKVDELMAHCDQLEQQQTDSNAAHEILVKTLLDTLTNTADQNELEDAWQSIADHFSTLFTTESSIDQLKQTILQLAVMGKLVPQNSDDEPASVLLEKIAKEKSSLVKESKIKLQKQLPEISEDERPYPLPEGWEWIRLNQIISISSGDGLTSSKMNSDGEIPVYGGNGITGYHDKANVYQTTLVIGRVGFYCGSIHITPQYAWVTDNAFVTRFSAQNIYINFLYWLLKGTNLKENESATAQPVISGRKIYPIVVRLPPQKEQHRIVAKVDELFAICDVLKERLNDAQSFQIQLADAMVKYAKNEEKFYRAKKVDEK